MPETRTITVFTIQELDGKAKERAVQIVGEWLQDDANGTLEEDFFVPVLDEWGFPTDKIEWSLGYSQGDGMAFYGSIDVEAYLRKTKRLRQFHNLGPACPALYISRNSFGAHYSHYNTMTVNGEMHNEDAWTEKRQALLDKLIDLVQEDVRTVSRELERAGYDALDVPEEDIREHCDANDFRFNADGTVA